jgi:hypothetical protein
MSWFWKSVAILNIALCSTIIFIRWQKGEAPFESQNEAQRLVSQDVTGYVSPTSELTQSAAEPSLSAHQVHPLDPAQTQGFEKLDFVKISVDYLRDSRIIYKHLVPPGSHERSPENVQVNIGEHTLYLFKNKKACPKSVCPEPIGEGQSPLLVIVDKKKKIVATIQSWRETRMGGMFSLCKFSGANGNETLVWSVHTGGADLAFDHFLIELTPKGKLRMNTDFVRTIAEKHLDVRGNIEMVKSNSKILNQSDMRGLFLTLPKEQSERHRYDEVIDDSKFKQVHFMAAIPLWPKVAKNGEEEIVLMQFDGPRITFNPLWAERFVYQAIEWRDGEWKDASQLASAKAFYRAVERDLFKELSKYDGAVRNWMLGSWASYKALLGEWEEAKEIVKVKGDARTYREQLCEVFALLDRNPNGGIEAAKVISYINYQRERKIPLDPKCVPVPYFDFLEKELEHRGFLRAGH